MTFWQDARPRRRGSGGRRPRAAATRSPAPRSRRAAVAVAPRVVVASWSRRWCGRGAGPRGERRRPRGTRRPTRRRRGRPPRGRSRRAGRGRCRDWPASLLADDARRRHRDRRRLGERRSTLGDGDSRWQTRTDRLHRATARCAATRSCSSTETGLRRARPRTGTQRWRTRHAGDARARSRSSARRARPPVAVGVDGARAGWSGSTAAPGGPAGRCGSRATSRGVAGRRRRTRARSPRSGRTATATPAAGRSTARPGRSAGSSRSRPLAGSPVVADGRRRPSVVVGAGNGRLRQRGPGVRARRRRSRGGGRRSPASFQPGSGAARRRRRRSTSSTSSAPSTRLDLADRARAGGPPRPGPSTIDGRPMRVGDAILVANVAGEVVTLDRATGAIRARRRTAGLPSVWSRRGRLVLVAQRLVGASGAPGVLGRSDRRSGPEAPDEASATVPRRPEHSRLGSRTPGTQRSPPDLFRRCSSGGRSTTRGKELPRGCRHYEAAAGGRSALRPPDAPLEPEDAAIHLR